MNRIYFPESLDEFIEIKDQKFHKISSVLRMKTNDKLQIFDGKGISQIMQISEISKNSIHLKRTNKIVKTERKSPEVILALALIKPSRFEIAIEKTSELGVSKIYPMITENTNSVFEKRINKNRIERMKNISISASEQCGNDFITSIENPLSFNEILGLQNKGTALIMYYENLLEIREKQIDFKSFSRVIILIGPEGGFTDSEYRLLKDKSYVFDLGENILRTETAAICAVHEVNNMIRSIL